MSIAEALKGLLRKTKLPTVNPANTGQAIQDLKQIAEVLTGKRGSPLDRAVTLRDLVDAGVITYSHHGTLIEGGVSGDSKIGRYSRAIPPAITNLTATGGLGVVFLTWGQPAYSNYAYTEIWRSATDNLGDAVRIGTAITAVYADDVGDGDTYYYWARAVTIADVTGPFNAVSGVEGKPAHDPGYVMSLLTIKWEVSHTYAVDEYVIPTPSAETGLWYKATVAGTSGATEPNWPGTVGQTVVDGGVTWQAIAAGTNIPPFIIGEVDGNPVVCINGDLYADGAVVARMVAAGAVTADKINVINLAAISANLGAITGGSLDINNQFIVDSLGNMTANAGTFAGSLNGADGTFSGTLTADAVNAVDTINIAGQAVTIPASAYTDGSINLPQDSWTTIQTLTVSATGSPAVIQWQFYKDYSTITDVRVQRNGVTLYTIPIAASVDTNHLHSGFFADTRDVEESRTYTLQVYNGSSSLADPAKRGLTYLETKR